MRSRTILTGRRRLPLLLLLALALVAGCSDAVHPTDPGTTEDPPTDPPTEPPTTGGPPTDPEPTHFEMSLKMSSISAIEDCESTPGNPGDFRYTLQVTRLDELGNRIIIGTFGPDEMTVGDGDVLGSTMEPIRFLMPREPGATFQVEYWLGEYDPAADMEVHGYQNHTYDRNDEQEWAAGTRAYDRYNDAGPDESYGILKFAVWNTRGDCKGFANYYVGWKPVFPADGD